VLVESGQVGASTAAHPITSVPVLVGLLRYLQLIMVRGHGESPTDLVLSDSGMVTTLVFFAMAFAYLIYF
jgi:hypothetical protein